MTVLPEYDRLDALGLADLVRRKRVSPAELLDAAVDRLERRNVRVNAVIHRMIDRARAEIAAGLPQGPFTGVPYLLKDLEADVAGEVTTYGSAFFRDAVAARDAEIVVRSRAAGLVVFGKTNTPELGLCTSTEPLLFGPTRNPWSPAHGAGGSSGGSAAAVAAGIVPMAHATDGGGSIRIPASACGLFGLKPTRARTPVGPAVGERWSGASCDHAITRSVRDSAALLDATSGPARGDPYWAPPPARPFLAEVETEPGRLRIAFTTRAWNGQPVHPECVEATTAAAKLCESLGHDLEEATPEWDEAARAEAHRLVIAAHTRARLERRGETLGRAPEPGDVEHHTWSTAEHGRERPASAYAHALVAIHRAGREIAAFFTRYDLLLTPTMCRPPHELGVLSARNPDARAYGEALHGTLAFTAPFNSSGNPAMSVPLHWTRDGLPVGVQLVAPFGDEATLFRLAGQLERARPWGGRRPALASE